MKEKTTNNAFTIWDPVAYLQEYFPSGVDIEPVVKLIAEEGKRRLSPNALAIDIGCGPTVCYWSALASHVQELHLADYFDNVKFRLSFAAAFVGEIYESVFG